MTPHKPKKSRRKPKVKPSRRGSQGHKEICFIICPFGGWNDTYCEEIFEPAVESAGMAPRRADDLYRPSAIVHDIWDFVKKSRVMLAELTGRNPNVLYELGLAHAAGKPVIMVTQSMDDVPFDLRSLRVLVYDVENPSWSTILKENIQRALEEVLSSPELAVPPSFLHARRDGKQPSVSPIKRKLLELEQQVHQLRSREQGRPQVEFNEADAEALIEDLVRQGKARSYIFGRLTSQGVPFDWVQKRLQNERRAHEVAKAEPAPEAQTATSPTTESNQQTD